MPVIDDALVRAVAGEVSVIARHMLEQQDRINQLSQRVYPQLAHAHPCADKDFERFLLLLCKARNDMHNMFAPLAHWAEQMTHYQLPSLESAPPVGARPLPGELRAPPLVGARPPTGESSSSPSSPCTERIPV